MAYFKITWFSPETGKTDFDVSQGDSPEDDHIQCLIPRGCEYETSEEISREDYYRITEG